MSRDGVQVARRAAVTSAVVALFCTTGLVADHLVASWRAPAEKSRIERLEARTKTDPTLASSLHDERKRQTDVTLGRESRGRVLAWLLLVAGGAFVVSGKWYVSLRPQPLPSLDELVAVRFAPPSRVKRTPTLAPAPAPAEGDAIDLSFVDGLVARFGPSREAAIPILQALQTHFRYLPDEALRRVCARTEITPAQIAGTSSFYAQFRRSPVGLHLVRVCHGTACHVAGAEQITQELRRHLRIAPDADTDAERRFTLDPVACLGCCSLAPVMMVEEETAGRLTPASARQALDAVERDALVNAT
jgi:NADH:ubiquinone oxidoreductase subunit E